MEPKVAKRTKKIEQRGSEGLIKDGDNTIREDSWLHPDIWDEEAEKASNRRIRSIINKDKPIQPKKVEKSIQLLIDLPIPTELFIDLNKGTLDTTKLVKKPVQVHGKNGKVFTRMMWVDPSTGQPVSHSGHTSSSEEPVKTISRKDHIDKKLKEMSTEDKYKMIDKHNIQYKHNDHEAILHKNKVMALKEHLNKNPHLVGADHLPEDTNHTPDGTDKINDWVSRFKNDGEKLYDLMRQAGIADIDPRGNKEDKVAPIKHMHNMTKLKAYLKDNPHLMDDSKYDVPGKPSPSQTKSPKSRAEAGGNDIHSILKSMSSDELYTLMRNHNIASVDPRLDTSDASAPIKHMHNMMKLKKLVESNPDILRALGLPQTADEEEKGKVKEDGKGIGSFNDENSKFIGDMSRALKEKLIKQYDKHPDMANRSRSDNPNIDYMRGVEALKKLFHNNPDIANSHKGEAGNEFLMSYKIGNKSMAKILRAALGLKGVGDVKSVEDGVEWAFATGFVRREQDDSGEPVLSVVETGKDGTDWNEHVIPVRSAVSIMEGSSGTPEVRTAPLHESTLENIASKLDEDFDAHYTHAVGERLKEGMPSMYREFGQSTSVRDFASGIGVSNSTMSKMFDKWGVKTADIGGRDVVARSGLTPFKRIVFSDMISSTKNSSAHNYIYRNGDHYDVFPLHESARQWDDTDKTSARKELIHSSIEIPDSDRVDDHEERHPQLVNHLHESLGHVPFDLLTHMLADGYKMRFTTKDFRGEDHMGNHYVDNRKLIEFHHSYYSHPSIFKGTPLDHVPDSIPHPTMSGMSYGQHHFADTAAHEFAHAMDNFLSGNKGFLQWGGNTNGQTYVPKGHRQCVPDSYHKQVKSSNPNRAFLGRGGGSGNPEWLYHKDNWISTYEARIYDRSYYDPNTRHEKVGFDSHSQTAHDKDYSTTKVGKYGVEHWSENVARYSNAQMAFKIHKELDPGYKGTIDDWAADRHKEIDEAKYTTEEDPKMTGGWKSYRRIQNLSPDATAGFLWHEQKLKYPDLHNSIKSILGRGDFMEEAK